MTTYHPDTTTSQSAHATGNGSSSETWSETAKAQLDARRAQARDAAETAQAHAQEITQRGSEETARFVRENPVLALTGAVGAGILIGLILRDRL
jgi:ElaB/YqjD/DUF883 family membrane-anchored ribosome-binding protein